MPNLNTLNWFNVFESSENNFEPVLDIIRSLCEIFHENYLNQIYECDLVLILILILISFVLNVKHGYLLLLFHHL